jgi:hypothetical protein
VDLTEKIVVYRTAKHLIDQHGENAGFEAAMRAAELLNCGDTAGSATWRRIVTAIETLLETDADETIH